MLKLAVIGAGIMGERLVRAAAETPDLVEIAAIWDLSPDASQRLAAAIPGLPVATSAEAAMRAYLADNKGDRHGKFHYSTQVLTDIGEDIAALNAEFAAFRERFGVQIENRG